MNILSLFDGMSCGQIALGRAGVTIDHYWASEIDKYAMAVTQNNYPDTIQIGDVDSIAYSSLGKADLLLGGSPCQDLSVGRRGRRGLEGERSGLFWNYAEALTETKPSYFIFENVASMKQADKETITREFGVEPILIDSALVSAQRRRRLYWTNIPWVRQPRDRKVRLKDILCPLDAKLLHGPNAIAYMDRRVKDGRTHWDFGFHSDTKNEKSSAVVANWRKGVPYNVLVDGACIRKFHPIECERLQTVPDDYTAGVSASQRYKMLGNGWTVDVIAHILKGMN